MWLNILVDDCHLSNIMKLEKYKKKHWSKRAFSLGGEFHQNEKK
jgi:hypothetical protein